MRSAHGSERLGIDVHREGAGVVTRLLLDHFRAVTGLQSGDGIGVTQIRERMQLRLTDLAQLGVIHFLKTAKRSFTTTESERALSNE